MYKFSVERSALWLIITFWFALGAELTYLDTPNALKWWGLSTWEFGVSAFYIWTCFLPMAYNSTTRFSKLFYLALAFSDIFMSLHYSYSWFKTIVLGTGAVPTNFKSSIIISVIGCLLCVLFELILGKHRDAKR